MKLWMLHWIGLHTMRVFAGGPPLNSSDKGIDIVNPLACDTITKCIQGLLNTVVWLSVPIVSIMILIGGFQIMSSGGDEEKLKKGKNTIVYTIVGFAVILLASGVAAVIQDFINKSVGSN